MSVIAIFRQAEEPSKNLSSKKGLVGLISKKSANAGKRHEIFRFNESSFKNMIDRNAEKYNFSYSIIEQKKDIIITITN